MFCKAINQKGKYQAGKGKVGCRLVSFQVFCRIWISNSMRSTNSMLPLRRSHWLR